MVLRIGKDKKLYMLPLKSSPCTKTLCSKDIDVNKIKYKNAGISLLRITQLTTIIYCTNAENMPIKIYSDPNTFKNPNSIVVNKYLYFSIVLILTSYIH